MEKVPAEVFPPGEFIREELEERGWTQEDFAEILGRPRRLVNEILMGKRGITTETANGLGAAFGTSAQFWLNLESAYRLSRVQDKDVSIVERRAHLYSIAPVQEMIRRNWIEPSENIAVLERRFMDFFGIEHIDEVPTFWAYAARKSTPYQTLTPTQRAWLFRARHLAPALSAGRYSSQHVPNLVKELRNLTTSPEEVRHVPRRLADAGIRFLVIEPLRSSRIDGACFWLDEHSPVIVLSLRYERIDYFWHTLIHELGHIKNEDGLKNNHIPFDTDIITENPEETPDKPEYEKATDNFAANTLIPHDELENFIVRVGPLYSQTRIMGFANRMDIHPGIVLGQLQHKGEISYSKYRPMLVPIRRFIVHTALTDGWRSVLPATV
jgi:HTH-type transcriptional regulator/antitoxin HigA